MKLELKNTPSAAECRDVISLLLCHVIKNPCFQTLSYIACNSFTLSKMFYFALQSCVNLYTLTVTNHCFSIYYELNKRKIRYRR